VNNALYGCEARRPGRASRRSRASQPQAERATKEASDGQADPCVVVAAVIFGGGLVTLLVVAVMPEVQHLLRLGMRGGVLDDRVFRQRRR
jgi:hypothetical protein